MNYPVWELYYAGGGLLIALMAVVHVYVAHFAVGGGLFLVLTEMKGLRENSTAVLEYTRKHSKFFLLLTMVFSSVTGVGIWFTISLLSPAATSVLIHTFVFGFAMEWVFFILEIVALFLYFYTFNKIDHKAHLILGWIYAVSALISLILINGIISFMQTPGDWLVTRSFWDGFFNPSFWPSMFFRITISLVLAGIFGFITAVFIKDPDFKENMVCYCARWLLLPFIFMVLFAWWYFAAFPDSLKAMILGRSPEIVPLTKIFAAVLPVLFIGGLLMAIRVPGNIKKYMAFVILVIGLVYMGSFEWIREASRRPFLIYGHMYSNSIKIEDEANINKHGFLKTAKWVKHQEISDANMLHAGREIFNLQCITCHSVGGALNDILPLTKKFTVFGMDSQLNGQGKINDYMPKFMGTRMERLALSRYMVEKLHGKADIPTKAAVKELPAPIDPFDEKKDEYILLAWSNIGMRCISDSASWFILTPPGNDISAYLIRRGETPEMVTQGVKLTYKVEPGFEYPSKTVKFWNHAQKFFGKKLPPDIGLTGNGLKGKMKLDDENQVFVADGIPVVPYSADNRYNPYPLFTIEAMDQNSGKRLARTRVVASVSTEMGCKNCHGGKWRMEGVTGISDETASDILAMHDKISKTELLKMAQQGKPYLCKSCHLDANSDTKSKPGVLNLSAAIHGFHANYLTDRDVEACHACHPSSAGGHTQCLRGIHHEIGLDCTSCHGNLEDHALSLLVAEQKAGKKSAKRLMKHLVPTRVDSIGGIKPRNPWINQPDCLNCHIDFNPPETDQTFNQWTKSKDQLYRSRTGDAGIMCQACHSTTHAVYPATNIYGNNRDNIQPFQYQGNPYPIASNKNCKVCHTIDMDEELHHPNSLAMFRNVR
ncbi:MAG: cytochrome ubiquinol oxidase subunit I [Thermodesulfobacteriota bacterium]|nr:cytochrome ubiquinol oxidase subunit I [Thermodesulfobacteriota bacterium]